MTHSICHENTPDIIEINKDGRNVWDKICICQTSISELSMIGEGMMNIVYYIHSLQTALYYLAVYN